MYHVSPDELLLQLFSSFQRGRRSDDGGDESNSTSGREVMDLLQVYNHTNTNSSDDENDGDASDPEDFFS